MMDVLTLTGRYLRSRRIALVCVLAVAIGVLALIVLFSLMDGAHAFLRGYFARTRADLTIRVDPYRSVDVMKTFDSVSEALGPMMESQGGPVKALSPRFTYGGLLVPGEEPDPNREDLVRGVQLIGVDFELERQVIDIEGMLGSVVETLRAPTDREGGSPLARFEDGRPAIVIGDTLANELGLSARSAPGIETIVTIITGRVKTNADGGTEVESKSDEFRVAACFSSGHREFDQRFVFVDRQVLRQVVSGTQNRPADAKVVQVKLTDPARLDEAMQRIAREAPQLLVQSWERSPDLRTLEDQKRVLFLILGLVVIVACAAVCGLIAMMVMEKVRDIGILMSMGMSRMRVVLAFLFYGVSLTLIGALVGLVLALQVTAHLDSIVHHLSEWFDVELLNPEVYGFKSVPVERDPRSMAQVVGGVLIAGFFASLLPALKVAFMSPVRCFRSE